MSDKFCARKPLYEYSKENSNYNMVSNKNNNHNIPPASMGDTNVVCNPIPKEIPMQNNMAHKCIELMAMPTHLPPHAMKLFPHKYELPE
jgi:hypothetical protein